MTTIDKLIAYETSAEAPADGRRVIRDARLRLQSATQRAVTHTSSSTPPAGTWAHVQEAEREALDLLAAWS